MVFISSEAIMNDWMLEKMDQARRNEIRSEMDRINLERLAGQAGKSQPLLFKLGNGLVALGRNLRRRSGARRRDYWAVQNELGIDRR
jgi:hypothetical protein